MGRRKRQKPLPMEGLSATSSNHFPELIYEILLRLPPKSLLRFKCVSKSWKTLISDPRFIQSHHNLSTTSFRRTKVFCWYEYMRCFGALYFDDEEFHTESFYFPPEKNKALVFGSCHGLVVLREYYSKENFYLWNPSVKKYAKFSCPLNFDRNSRGGLCYDSDSDDYKVVAISEKFYCVYSLRKGSWGETKAFSYSKNMISEVSVLADGALYWVLSRYEKDNAGSGVEVFECSSWPGCEILRFGLKEESFSTLPRPEFLRDGTVFYLKELGGRLGFYCFSPRNSMMKIWLRNGRGCDGVICWEELIVISNVPVPRRGEYMGGDVKLCYVQGSDILVYVERGGFFLYDAKRGKFHKSHGGPHDHFPSPLTTVAYVDSLLLPGVGDKPKRRWRWLKTESRKRVSTGKMTEDIVCATWLSMILSGIVLVISYMVFMLQP